MKSNEPFLIQALEDAVKYRVWLACNRKPPGDEPDWKQVREYRKLLNAARGRVIAKRSRDPQSEPRQQWSGPEQSSRTLVP